MPALSKGLSAPLPIALDAAGRFDASSQERLARWALKDGRGAGVLFSSPDLGEAHPPEILRQANEAVRFAAPAAALWAGVGAAAVADLLANLEGALGLKVQAAVLNPTLVADCADPLQLFHRHIRPLFERLGRSLPIILEDSGGERRLRTGDLKQLSRLDFVSGVCVSAGPKVVGNYLKGARHYKARHEFGVWLGEAGHIFSLFRPSRGPLSSIKERLNRFWLGAELPQGIAPLSACLFPEAWRQAWDAAFCGDAERMEAFEQAFAGLGPVDLPRLRAALQEEGVLSSDTPAPGAAKRLEGGERQAWMFEYLSTKKELSRLVGTSVPRPDSTPIPTVGAGAPARLAPVDIAGIGGVVVDEFRMVDKILGPDSKVKVRGPAVRRPGGVMLNQLAWARCLGARALAFGPLGEDADGDWLRREMRLRGIGESLLKPVPGGRTPISRIMVDAQGEREIYLEAGAIQSAQPKDMAAFEPAIKAATIVSTEISLLPLGCVLEVIRLAHLHGKRVAVDLDIPPSQATSKGGLGTRAQLESLLKQADLLKASAACARELLPKAAPGALASALHKKYAKKKGAWVAVTLGAKGCLLSDGGRDLRLPAAKGLRAADTTGCGDAFMGALLLGTIKGLKLRDLGSLGNAAGAACCGHVGAVPEKGARAGVLKRYKGAALDLEPEAEARPEDAGGDANEFLRAAVNELEKLGRRFPEGYFGPAKSLIQQAVASGKRLHVTGVGKPEYVAGFIASSYSSTGTPAFFLHATEAGHGASGQVSPGDVVIAISNSGETAELKSAVATVKKNGARVIGVSGKTGSWLARQSDAFLFAGVEREGDALNMAPRASVLAEVFVLCALGVELQHDMKFSADDFRNFHPGGSLGIRND